MPKSLVRADAGPPVVELLVEPSWEVQRAAELAGTPVSMSSVAQQVATPSFSLPLDLGALDPGFVASEGYVNVLVVARYAGRVMSWGTTVWPRDRLVQVPTLDMAKAVPPPGGSDAGALSVEPQAAPCGQIVWGDYNGPYETKIMNVMNHEDIQAAATCAWRGSTSTTLGFLTNGPDWVAGGTMTREADETLGFVAHPANARIQTLWTYRERTVVCIGRQNVPYNHAGRGSTPAITHVNHPYCGGFYYPPDDKYLRDYGNNQTFAVGLRVYGIDLSSQAGCSETAKLRFRFTDTRGVVCGNDPYLVEASPKVDARPA